MEPKGTCQSLVGTLEASHGTHLDLVPVLTGEGILGFLLETLLSLRKPLIFSNSHDFLFFFKSRDSRYQRGEGREKGRRRGGEKDFWVNSGQMCATRVVSLELSEKSAFGVRRPFVFHLKSPANGWRR
jgi:hypothetical protein